MKFNFICIFLFLSFSLFGQKEKSSILFQLTLDSQFVEIDKNYSTYSLEDSISFEAIRFYISNVEFFQYKKIVFSLEKKHHLIDLENSESMRIEIETYQDLEFNQIKFNLGIDSLTNVSGAFGGDLDPSNGMYWTWQSGYINFKLEGISKVCPARHHRFQYHLGGYQAPYPSMQKIILPLSKTDSKEIKINFAIDKFFKTIKLQETYQVMSPNQEAVDMAKLVASIFTCNL